MQEENNDHPLYYISLIGVVVVVNIALTFMTWFCYNLVSYFIDIATLELFDAFIFVTVFLILDYAKQILFELVFIKYEQEL